MLYSPYIALPDKSGNYYDNKTAMDMDKYKVHRHSVKGAHGFIVFKRESTGDWLASPGSLVTFLFNHGLKVKPIDSDLFKIIKLNIKAGLPLVGHVDCGYQCGHYLQIIGYDTGTNNNKQEVICNDPYGDYNNTWNGSTSGVGVTYPMSGVAGTRNIIIDRVYTVHPIGIAAEFPGWMKAGNGTFLSQSFKDLYDNKTLLGAEGKDIFGIPWDNSDYGPHVHPWPDNWQSTPDKLYLQDYLHTDENGNEHWWQLVYHPDLNKVFPIHGQLLTFWHDNLGYIKYGAPSDFEYNARNSSGHLLVVQKFTKWGVDRYIAYNTVLGFSKEYNILELHKMDSCLISDDVDYYSVFMSSFQQFELVLEPLPQDNDTSQSNNISSSNDWSVASYGLYGYVNHNTSEPSDKRTRYTNTDGRVASYFKFNNLQNSLRID